ncbi:Arc family DNA-binding protein [Serratia grimesii]|uniref:Arc family DNA-binding protein n=1 Tax=Serratia grimesii TaxID=82995 RepID=UPI0021BD497E|nr:Arc family DNA-binding protein [Serratia grimesii]
MRSVAPMGVRVPDDLKERIQQRAQQNGRSMASEIVHMLQSVIDSDDGKVDIDDQVIAGVLVKLRRHTHEQDMLINELVQAMESKKPIR